MQQDAVIFVQTFKDLLNGNYRTVGLDRDWSQGTTQGNDFLLCLNHDHIFHNDLRIIDHSTLREFVIIDTTQESPLICYT